MSGTQYENFCPRCKKNTQWKDGEPYQRGFQEHECLKCGLTVSDDWEDYWSDPDEKEKQELIIKYKN